MRSILLIAIILIAGCIEAIGQQVKTSISRSITWTGVKKTTYNETDSVSYISFKDAIYKNHLPYYFAEESAIDNTSYSVILKNQKFAECSAEEIELLGSENLKNEILVTATVSLEKKKPFLCYSFLPFRKNSSTGKIEKLISFIPEINTSPAVTKQKKNKVYAANSVLATGNWFKFAVPDNGVYKLTYSDLANMGIDMASLNPQDIRIYGNGGGMLSEDNFVARYDDLMENAIYVYDGGTAGVFDNTDYVLFYGSSPVKWALSAKDNKFHHQQNYYTDATYYFLTTDLGPGKRISNQASNTNSPTKFITKFDDYLYHEKDSVNLIQSGKEWYGENMDILTSYSFDFSFPSIDLTSKVQLDYDIAGRYSSTNYYTVVANGHSRIISDSGVSGQYLYASSNSDSMSFTPTGPDINVQVTKTTAGAIGWVNYIEINAVSNLSLSSSQLQFRSIASVGAGNISQFTIGNAATNGRIWDVTNPINVKEQAYTASGNDAVFSLATDSLKEFVAFNGSSYKSIIPVGKVTNQNLHALGSADFIIVSYPDFVSEANRIASIHATHDGLSSVVVTPAQIYNEFSSGAQDISAIRDFVKMFYDRATTEAEMPKYLLLFGDASYDYKDRVKDNTNMIPTYESPDALDKESSYASDDFYGFLDNSEGTYTNSLLDIAIGRFPVNTLEQAQIMVDKVNHYLTKINPTVVSTGCSNYSSSGSGDWRNIVCFIADDEEGNDFFNNSEALATAVDTTYNNYNIDKIYCDAYVQVTGAGGQRYPDVNDAINKRVEKGALIMNYIGHGGEVGWALERILQISDIQSWTNVSNMPMFVTATCEFSRYDDPGRTSAGELVLLQPDGGGISLLTTARVAWSGTNQTLNEQFFRYAFKKINGSYPTMGELSMLSKNGPSTVITQVRFFVFLGDPALKLSYPENTVVTTKINGHTAGSVNDTLKAFDKVTISGILQDPAGQKLTGFNGILYPTVFDKKSVTSTLGNDPTSYVANFLIQKSILYKGKVSVVNGDFSFTFIVPKDIAYNYGIGRISYYAADGETDANGYYENSTFIIGGSDTNAATDNTGPEIKLYLNDSSFVYGGITDEKPLLLAYVRDSNGINTVGNGIGHDVVAVLDENTNKSIVLNDYYEADLNSYQKGSIRYPFTKLSDGRHTLSLKVWDIYNNSSEAYIEFVVAQSAQLALSHVLNYPNPFTTHTEFFFEHNQPCCTLDAQVQIFTVTGKLIKTIDKTVETMGYRAEPIEWDGLDDFGDPIAKGVYIYKLKIKNADGSSAEKTEKLVILR
jgi:hypothetical protein